jgi:hypothetical protein
VAAQAVSAQYSFTAENLAQALVRRASSRCQQGAVLSADLAHRGD